MKYYDKLDQYMGDNLETAKKELIKFATPQQGGCEVLFNQFGEPVCGFTWTKGLRPGKWYEI